MTTFQKFNKLITLLLIIMLVFSFTACKKNDSGLVFDFATIDLSTVVETEDSTSFVATANNGTSMHFEGYGFTVTENGIVMEPGGRLFSLDYVGQIEEIYFEADGGKFDLDLGVAYANTPNPESMMNLVVAMALGGVTNEPVELSEEYNVNFLAAGVSQTCTQTITLKKLHMEVDPEVPQVFYVDLDPTSQVYDWLNGDYGCRIDWQEKVEWGMNDYVYALEKIQEPNVLCSDIIAGIDHSSIVTEGTTTFFSSTMSDGTVVRFEGENIKIDDKGIYITPQSSVVGLDAVGKIYGYYPTVADRELYAGKSVILNVGYGYTYSAAKTSVECASDVHTWSINGIEVEFLDGEYLLPVVIFSPNFFQFSGFLYSEENYYLSSLVACYDPSEKVTKMVDAKLYGDFSGYYMEGDIYDPSKENSADLEKQQLDFYLILEPDTEIADMDRGSYHAVYYVPKKFFEVGALRDASGKELDKENAVLTRGCTLDLTVGDSEIRMPLEIVERYHGAETMNDLVPYAYPEALGEMNTLVVPIIWADQADMASNETLELYRKRLGRIVDTNGKVTDYSETDDEGFSLSEYFDKASYGKLGITSFMTDWYFSDDNFVDMQYNMAEADAANDLLEWVKATYPNLDWSKYDQDANGYVDSMIILSAGVGSDDGFNILSYGGAYNQMTTYYGDYAGTPESPLANVFSVMGYHLMKDDATTLIHEFSHGLGLIDYYDVMYSGIDAVGKFDMQSGSYGDWNAYSKLTMGWMEPQIVRDMESGQSVEFTIGSSALTDDMIIIPAAGKEYEGPFSEYIMLDLFTDDGVNEYDTEKDMFELKDVAGVRISHVNAQMEKRTNTIVSTINPGNAAEYTIGTIHTANNYTGNVTGKYNVEVMQNGGKNTFTNMSQLDPVLDKDDLFYAGDTFTAEDYSEFLYEGRMDDASDFGYIIEIISIDTDTSGIPYATIRVTRKG